MKKAKITVKKQGTSKNLWKGFEPVAKLASLRKHSGNYKAATEELGRRSPDSLKKWVNASKKRGDFVSEGKDKIIAGEVLSSRNKGKVIKVLEKQGWEIISASKSLGVKTADLIFFIETDPEFKKLFDEKRPVIDFKVRG